MAAIVVPGEDEDANNDWDALTQHVLDGDLGCSWVVRR